MLNGTRSVSAGFPSVTVPVLSSTTTSTRPAAWRALPSRTSTPASAALPTATMIEIGVASPSAQGQAITSTDTAITTAKLRRGSGPKKYHTVNARRAIPITVGTNTPAT